MSSTFLSFKKRSHSPSLQSKGSKKTLEGDILDYGTLGSLNYEIYKRGVIKIFDKADDLVFKKDINLFETEIVGIDFENMVDAIVIKGSGDNDHLVFTKVDGDIEMSLKKRGFPAIETLRSALTKGKKLLNDQKGGK